MAGLHVIDAVGGEQQEVLAARTFYSRLLIQELFHWLVAVPYGDREDIPLRAGQTIDWRKMARFAAATTPLTEGAAPGATNLVLTNVSATVAQYGGFVKWSDKFAETAPDPWVSETVVYQGRQAALTFDQLVLTELLNSAHEVSATATTPGTDIDAMTAAVPNVAYLDAIIEGMHSRHVPYVTQFLSPNGGSATVPGLPGYIAIIGPKSWTKLKAVAGVDSVDTYQQGNNTLPREVGKYDNLRFVMTTNEQSFPSSTGTPPPTVYPMFVLGQGAFGISSVSGREVSSVVRPVGTPAPGDELGQTGSVGWKSYFVAKIKNSDALTVGGWAE